ncbi:MULTISPECIES: hypothetical protein [unclassified Bradyrhizobium]|uniref:hypothetical protein n=1 Tax=unclassified Bradyrhizobium TaxID=2631580 RepID=UPI001FFA07FE|nr:MULTISPECIES: hypothetical protein [unclassified Bradyrhizobium]MCK1540350.1 hypothetical protein [Bradyrhizobium sp. 176]MCK1556192.1 hypothetical protein [Bradyrhizobium sp. 171]
MREYTHWNCFHRAWRFILGQDWQIEAAARCNIKTPSLEQALNAPIKATCSAA